MNTRRRYAEKTTVPAMKSRNDIEKTLTKYGADGFMYGWADGSHVVMFRMNNRQIKFVLPVGDEQGTEAKNQQEERRRWRALLLAIKAKLETVASDIAEFEDEFMANIVLPDGQTVGQHMRPQIASSYETGKMPALLPAPGGH